MSLQLKQSHAVSQLAGILMTFIPGSGNSKWKGHISFKSISEKLGIGNYWQQGSKRPMVISLIERTLEHRRELFERLILEVVRAGIPYREKQGNPITLAELDEVNGSILILGFKFPDLMDPEFRDSLAQDGGSRARIQVEKELRRASVQATATNQRLSHLERLKLQFFALHDEPDRNAAGLALEDVLNRLFALHGLAPREPFRVVGEQIDGSFELDHEIYLVEAKWERERLPEASLLVFRGKIEGKSKYTRGVFIAINGISNEAEVAITRGKQPNFFVLNGHDLTMILSDDVGLSEFLRQRQRLLAEEGRMVVPYNELWSGKSCRS